MKRTLRIQQNALQDFQGRRKGEVFFQFSLKHRAVGIIECIRISGTSIVPPTMFHHRRGTVPVPLFFTEIEFFPVKIHPAQMAFTAFLMALMWAGVVPQHPPIILAPASTIAGTMFAISSGVSGKTLSPSIYSGNPAFA